MNIFIVSDRLLTETETGVVCKIINYLFELNFSVYFLTPYNDLGFSINECSVQIIEYGLSVRSTKGMDYISEKAMSFSHVISYLPKPNSIIALDPHSAFYSRLALGGNDTTIVSCLLNEFEQNIYSNINYINYSDSFWVISDKMANEIKKVVKEAAITVFQPQLQDKREFAKLIVDLVSEEGTGNDY